MAVKRAADLKVGDRIVVDYIDLLGSAGTRSKTHTVSKIETTTNSRGGAKRFRVYLDGRNVSLTYQADEEVEIP